MEIRQKRSSESKKCKRFCDDFVAVKVVLIDMMESVMGLDEITIPHGFDEIDDKETTGKKRSIRAKKKGVWTISWTDSSEKTSEI